MTVWNATKRPMTKASQEGQMTLIQRRDHIPLMVALAVMMLSSLGGNDGKTMGRATSVVMILHTNDLHGHITPWQGWEGDLAGKTVWWS